MLRRNRVSAQQTLPGETHSALRALYALLHGHRRVRGLEPMMAGKAWRCGGQHNPQVLGRRGVAGQSSHQSPWKSRRGMRGNWSQCSPRRRCDSSDPEKLGISVRS
jgi:hypothetical protein